ncbi:hypothetical protein [Paenibacillus hubeiensis]|uniref:hypothetical protein n=1 Tax=Paenibacillus hubeiensis TaxID=3077330 RepID=UPI0031B9E276
MKTQDHQLRFEKGDVIYNATIKNCTYAEAKKAFVKKLREIGVLNVDPGCIRKGHIYE